MNKILKSIENASFKKIFQLALISCLFLSLPIAISLSQTETQLLSRASFEPSPQTKLLRGAPPKIAPLIESISPFIGKEGDLVIIYGRNFGLFPEGAKLMIGNMNVSENSLVDWQDKKVSFYIPIGAKSGQIMINNGFSNSNLSNIVTIYTQNTKTKISFIGEKLLIRNPQNISQVFIETESENIIKDYNPPLSSSSSSQLILPQLDLKKIKWITLYDAIQNPLPFYVDPAEFNF